MMKIIGAVSDDRISRLCIAEISKCSRTNAEENAKNRCGMRNTDFGKFLQHQRGKNVGQLPALETTTFQSLADLNRLLR